MGLSHRWPATTLITNGDEKDPMVAGVYDKPDHLYYSNGMAGEFTMLNKRVFDYNTDFKFSRFRTR